LEALQSDKAFEKLGNLGAEVLSSLEKMDKQIDDRELFTKALEVKLTATQFKLLQKHMGEHNDEEMLCYDKKGKLESNSDLRDYENVPLSEDIYEYFEREVKLHVPLAWIDEKKCDVKDGEVGIVGYEIPFNRHFYEYVPPRNLDEIDGELEFLSCEILELLNEI
jgi:type I restriction enzyme M protein